MPGQRAKVKCVCASIRLHYFQTKEPTSSLAQEKVPERSPREDPHMIEKQRDKSRPIGMPDVKDKRARHVDAIELRIQAIYIGPRPQKGLVTTRCSRAGDWIGPARVQGNV